VKGTSTKRARRAGLVVVVALALSAACAAPDPQWHDPVAVPVTAPSSPAAPRQITLAFAGDVNFMGRTLELLDEPRTAFGPIAEVLDQADLTIVNLETAVTQRGTKQPKTFHFRAPVTAYDALKAAGVDAVSIANNHTLDYGQVGLLDTLDSAAQANMPVFGAGRNVTDAYAAWITDVHGVRIAVVGMSQVHELAAQWKATDTRPGIAMAFDGDRAFAAVQEARRQSDLVIVYMHWGIEGNNCPSAEMKSFAAKMAAAGADIVLGTHAHTLLADGWIDDTYVHYGLGNFLWYLPS